MLDVKEQLGVDISGQDDSDIKAGDNHSVYVVFHHLNVRAAISYFDANRKSSFSALIIIFI